MTILGVDGSDKSGTPDGQNGGNSNGSGSAGDNPFSGLEEGTRTWVENKGIKTVEDLAKSALNAESLVGKSIQLPGQDASAEDWGTFESGLAAKLPADRRAPEKPEGYSFAMPEGLPQDFPYSEDLAGKFKGWAHDAGLSPAKTQAMHDAWVTEQAGIFKSAQEGLAAKAVEATDALEKAWGKSESAEFKASSADALRGIKGAGGDELLAAFNEVGLIKDVNGSPVVISAPIAIAFAKVGQSMFAEDTAHRGDGGGTVSNNPYKDGPGKGNATEQNLLWRNDQAKAEQLIRAAGHTPEGFGYRAQTA